MEWIDECAGIAARRYCHGNITTACIDRLDFLKGAHENDIIVLEAQVIYTGRTSMEVMVKTSVEHIDGELTLINTAFLVEVAMDENEKPRPVIPYVPETEEEKMIWELADQKSKLRKSLKN